MGIRHIVASVLLFAAIDARLAHADGSRYDKLEGWSAEFCEGSSTKWTAEGTIRTAADMNVDGMADLVGFGNGGVWVALANKQGGFGDAVKWTGGFSNGWDVRKHPRMLATVTNDNLLDVVGFADDGVWVAVSTGSTLAAPTKWSNAFSSGDGWDFTRHRVFLADVDGDQKSDIIAVGNTSVYVALSKGTHFATPTAWLDFGCNDTNDWCGSEQSIVVGNMNPDRKADIVFFGKQETYIAFAGDSKFVKSAPIGGFSGKQSWTSGKHVRAVADMNGDGVDEMIGFGDTQVVAAFPNDRGYEFVPVSKDFTAAGGWDVNKHPRHLVDVNGDGRADIVAFGNDGVYVALARKVGDKTDFAPSVKPWIPHFGAKDGWTSRYPRVLADVNGDGRPEPVGYSATGVLVTPSTALYCCDEVSFVDIGGNFKRVDGTLIARVFLPRAAVVAGIKPNLHDCSNKHELHPIVKNEKYDRTGWNTALSGLRLYITANFFDTSGGYDAYTSLCTQALGFVVSRRVIRSPFALVHGAATDTLVFYRTPLGPTGTAEILNSKDTTAALTEGMVEEAVSGFRLLQNGQYVSQPNGIDPDTARPRSAVGLTRDRMTLILAVVNAGKNMGDYPDAGSTLKGFANLLRALGADSALTLDGSGSAQFYFVSGSSKYQSKASDKKDGVEGLLYRPIPVILGVK